MATNNDKIIEYGVYEEIKGKYPPPVLLFKEKEKAKVEATHIRAIAKKHGFSVFSYIEKKEVNEELFYALTVEVGGASSWNNQYHELYYPSKEKAEAVLKEFKKDAEELSYFFETRTKIITQTYKVD